MKGRSLTVAALVIALAMGLTVQAAAQDWPGADSSSSGWPGTADSAPAPAPAPAPAQSAASDSGGGDSAPAKSSGGGGSAPRPSGGGGGGGLLAIVIGFLAKIGNLFGVHSLAGFKIGGTTGTGILALIIAQALKDKAPDWVRYVLMAGGGTMFTGSGANILQLLM